jgi:CRP-like cAMP-binding protein
MVHPQVLQKYSLFGGLTEDQIKSILPNMLNETYNPDEFIITEGKPNDKIYFLIEGQVAVIKGDIVLSKFSEGEAFGEMEVLDVMPAAASVKALTPVTLMSVSNQALRKIYRIDIAAFSLIIMNLARDLSRRLRKMDDKMVLPVLV